MLRLLSVITITTIALTIAAGCGGGVDFHKLNDAQKRIDLLKAKGVSLILVGDQDVGNKDLSAAEASIYQAKAELNKGNRGKGPAKEHYKALLASLDKAEKFYNEHVGSLGPSIDAAKSAALSAKAELSGFQARKIDSSLVVIDSFKRLDWLMQASQNAQALTAMLPGLKEDEQKSKTTRSQIQGTTWLFTEKYESELVSPSAAAITRKEFAFGRDGKIQLVESKKGQSGQYLKEDWLFRSWGTYDFKGDTIMIMVSRFKAEKQRFEKVDRSGKWHKDPPGPTYDSTITDGSQDRFITLADLKLDFKKIR